MEAKTLTRIIQKTLSVLYVLIGIFFVYEISLRLWKEGFFGDETFKGFVIAPLGPETGGLWLSAALTLTVGQVFVFFNSKLGTRFARVSFFLATLTLIGIYLVFQQWYIWSYTFDFLILLFLIVLFYLPILISTDGKRNPRT